MYLKKTGTALISTMIILSLMSILGSFMFSMMKNNLEIGSLYNFNKDRYDLDKSEEEILSKFMIEINKSIKEANKEIGYCYKGKGGRIYRCGIYQIT